MPLNFFIASGYLYFFGCVFVVHKDSLTLQQDHPQIYTKAHLRMGYLQAIFQAPVPVHQEEANDRSGGCNLEIYKRAIF